MVRGVIFDLDGTLADTLPLCVESFRRVVEFCSGRKLADEEITRHFGPSDRGVLARLLPGEDVERLENLFMENYTFLHLDMAPEPFPGVPELLEALKRKKFRLAMVTGKDDDSVGVTLDVYNLEDVFEYVETGSPERVVKGECIGRVLDAWGMSPDEAVYVGDAVSDIEACREVRVKVIAAAWAPSADVEALRRAEPDFLLTDMSELLPLISEI